MIGDSQRRKGSNLACLKRGLSLRVRERVGKEQAVIAKGPRPPAACGRAGRGTGGTAGTVRVAVAEAIGACAGRAEGCAASAWIR